MFGFKKSTKEKNSTIKVLEDTNQALRNRISEEIDARKYAEQNFEDAISSRVLDLEKLQEILGSNKQWKKKQMEATNYISMAIEVIKGKEN